jgi:hypothetical protein
MATISGTQVNLFIVIGLGGVTHYDASTASSHACPRGVVQPTIYPPPDERVNMCRDLSSVGCRRR